MTPEKKKFKVGSIVVAVGYDEYNPSEIEPYHYGQPGYEDVITQLKLERMLSPTSLTGSQILRPSDGKIPETIVFIHCAGSRDPAKHLPYCSKICCMYATKHALQYKHLVHDGVAINFYIDIRTGGKDYEEFYKRAAEEPSQAG